MVRLNDIEDVDFLTVNVNEKVSIIADLFIKHKGLYSIIVESEGIPIGIIGAFDILGAVADKTDLRDSNAKTVMSSPLVVIQIDDNIEKFFDWFDGYALPILSDNKVIKVTTIGNLRNALKESETKVLEI